ncbi:MAG: DUF268 domain-containing protein [Deltaproteobacteria bacterium]|nr:DUF268 domain-containing protein [Deltaproteobacteria bacterium]
MPHRPRRERGRRVGALLPPGPLGRAQRCTPRAPPSTSTWAAGSTASSPTWPPSPRWSTSTFGRSRPAVTRTSRPAWAPLLSLPFADRSVPSLSCLHVIEHIGLGRYGDPLDPDGSLKALAELQRVVAPGGDFYLGVPIGRERVCFNAHRVLSPQTVLRALGELSLVEFSAVNDAGDLVRDARPEDFAKADYSCGLFHFTRR